MQNSLSEIGNSVKAPTAKTPLLIGLAGLVTLLMEIVPELSLLNYPFRLLLTIVHELGHGLAALLTGGDFLRFVIFVDGSGQAYTSGGWRFVVIPAGYLGTALFGAVLIMVGRNYRLNRLAILLLGAAMVIFSLRYGIPGLLVPRYFLESILTVVSGVAFGAIFLVVGLRSSANGITFLIHLVAIQAGLTAFSDIAMLVGLTARLGHIPANDAQSMAELTFIPSIIWAILWVIIAVLLIGGAIGFTWVWPLKKRNHES